MILKIQKWGNSLALRIPQSFASQLDLKSGSSVDLSLEKDKLIIKPVTEVKYVLEDMISEVNEANTHYETDTGKPVGKEIW
jgi:antitoxin MazE